MEDWVIVAIICIVGIFSLQGMKMFQGKGKTKTRLSNAQDTLTKTYETNIERLSTELRKQTGRASRLQALRDGEEPELEEELTEDGGKQVTFDEIQALVKTKYPKQAILLPLIKKQVMEATKGMSMAQVLDYVKQFTGDKQPQGAPLPNDAAGYNPNWA